MSILIKGICFPLDVINANGWGVPSSEAQNAINSLKSSVIRVCTRTEAHICDFFEDPYAEIGRITDAWQDGGDIWAAGIITDSAAEAKILEGTWEKNWSVYAWEQGNENGFSQGFMARSMTLVRFPAWEGSTWDISAAEAAKKTEKIGRSSPSTFEIISASKKSACSKNLKGDKVADPTTDPTNDPMKEITARLDALEKALADIKAGPGGPGGPGGAAGDPADPAVQASITELEQKIKEQAAVIASFEVEKASMIPMEKLPEMIAAAIKEEKDKEARAAAFARFAAVRLERKLETKEEDYTTLSASDFDRISSEFETLRPISASGGQYPKSDGTGGGLGVYNPTTGGWDE